jgi:hypothetical protein
MSPAAADWLNRQLGGPRSSAMLSNAGVTIAPDSLPDDVAALMRIIADKARDATAAQAEIAKLKFQLVRYRRAEFGRSSEKLAREAEQLELAIEALEEDQGADSDGSRPRFRDDLARYSDLMSLTVPR